jgi:hypothetical protein
LITTEGSGSSDAGLVLVDGCRLRCSGDDAVNVSGTAAPVLRRCTLAGKKCGVRAFGSSHPRLVGCSIEECGEQGIKAAQQSAVVLERCMVRGCSEEAAVVMDRASLRLLDCVLSGCKGPGVDCSGNSSLTMRGGSVEGNVGGVWAWDGATIELERAAVEGGPAQAVLVDGGGTVRARGATIKGTVHAGEGAWKELLDGGNVFEDPDGATDFPPEEGPFRFVPDRFGRKM